METKQNITLTRAEEDIMKILWKIEKGFIKDILEYFDEPKPAYNTVSTIVRILETKGYVSHTSFGKTYEYYPLVSQKEYTQAYSTSFLKNHFNNSFHKMVSFFASSENVDIKELEETLKIMREQIEKQKNQK